MNKFENTKNALELTKTGLFIIEYEKDKKPRLFMDDDLSDILLINNDKTPEDLYQYWLNRIEKDSLSIVEEGMAQINSGKNVEIQYFWNHPTKGVIEFRVGCYLNKDCHDMMRIDGWCRNIDGINFYQKSIDDKFQQNLAFSEYFLEGFVSAYYINLLDHSLMIFHRTTELKENYPIVENYLNSILEYINNDVHEDDKKMMIEAVQPDFIISHLEKENSFSLVMRDISSGYVKYYRYQIIRGADKFHCVMGFMDISKEIKAEKKHNELLERAVKCQETLIRTSSGYLEVNLSKNVIITEIYDVINKNNKSSIKIPELGDVIKYDDFEKWWADNRLLSDKNEFLSISNCQALIEKFKSGTEVVDVYCKNKDKKGSKDNKQTYYLYQDNTNGDIMAFCIVQDITNEVKRKQALDRILQEERQNTKIIEALASEFTSVYYIDLENENITSYVLNDETKNIFGDYLGKGAKYSKAFKQYVENLVDESYRQLMYDTGSVSHIKEELYNKKSFTLSFLSSNNRFCEMKFVKVNPESELPTAVALGFADKDDEIKEEQIRELEQKRYYAVVKALSSEYSSVYYADIKNNILVPYSNSNRIKGKFGSNAFYNMTVTAAIAAYIAHGVCEKDQAMMTHYLDISYMKENLVDKPFYTQVYTNDKGQYCELKVVNANEGKSVDTVIVGFAVKDRMIREELEKKEIENRNTAVLASLGSDYVFVDYVSFLDNTEVIYRSDSFFGSYIPNWLQINDFSERFRIFTERMLHPDDKESLLKNQSLQDLYSRIKTSESYVVNFRTLVKDIVTYYQIKFVLDVNNPVHFIVGINNVDKETKRELEALDKAEKASKAKTAFLNNMSHDIRTPMNAIMGFTDLAFKYIDNKEKTIDSLNKVKSSSEHLLSLINDILDMSRIESGKVELDEKVANIENCGDNIVPMFYNLAANKQIDFSFNVEPMIHKYVYVDYLRFNQVIINVVSNAIKYTNPQGKVSLLAKEVPYFKKGYGMYQFICSDNGIGMSKEFQKIAFNTFAREKNSTLSKQQGTGLGLAITKTIVEMMNGTIEVQSELGVGSTFTINIPFRLVENPETYETNDKINIDYEKIFKGRKLLVVDDNQLNLEISKELLSDEGLVVDTADDGYVALEILTEKGIDYYDAILMDIQMPNLDGYETTKMIRKLYPEYHLPIIALSANAFEDDKKKSLSIGMDGHLSKPIVVNDLFDTLALLLKN